MDKLFIVSRYNEDFSWIKEYTNQYIVYNKGVPIEDPHVINTENIGNNQRDIFKFVYENYTELPDVLVFIQANPFDHCPKEAFEGLIKDDYFTAIESYGPPVNGWERRDGLGGYMELNNNWYIQAKNQEFNTTCKYNSFNEFMDHYFTNYIHSDWIRFTPGSQYIITKEIVLHYPKSFWKELLDELPRNNMTEGHIIERALWNIFQCIWEAR